MKVFIVFCAILMIFSAFLSFQRDMDIYIQDQKLLKMLSEDCAEAAALTLDDERGVIYHDRALSAAEEIVSLSDLFPYGKVSIEYIEISSEGKGCIVCLRLEVDDFFSLPFIEIGSMIRISEYVWE